MTEISAPSQGPGLRFRVLFFSEAVTLAHAARPAALAGALRQRGYDVTLAIAPRFAQIAGADVPQVPIHTIEPERFLEALQHGRALHDFETLGRYAAEDLRLLREIQPDAVIGDLRHSLAVSARVAKIRYLAITNAYWSPYCGEELPLPAHPLNRVIGLGAASALFRLIRPIATASHCKPLNRLRREYSLPGGGYDLRHMYTDADEVLYADVPELVPLNDAPPNHRFIGPVGWSPAVENPDWWNRIPIDRPRIYVTMGSSGSARIFGIILDALAAMPVTVLAARGHNSGQGAVTTGNAFLADYLPGDQAAAGAALVICNGGSPTTHQALAQGVPVVGIAANMDQHLNMAFVSRAGAGVYLRSEQATVDRIRSAAGQVLQQNSFKNAAVYLQHSFARYNCAARLASILAGE